MGGAVEVDGRAAAAAGDPSSLSECIAMAPRTEVKNIQELMSNSKEKQFCECSRLPRKKAPEKLDDHRTRGPFYDGAFSQSGTSICEAGPPSIHVADHQVESSANHGADAEARWTPKKLAPSGDR